MSAVVYTCRFVGVLDAFSPVPVANLLFVPLLSTVLVLASTALLLYGVPLIGAVTVNLAGFVTSVVLESVGITARDIGCTVSLRYPFVPYVLLVFAVTVAVCILDLRLRRRTRRFFAPVMLTVTFIACISVFSAVTADTVTVIYEQRHKRRNCDIRGNLGVLRYIHRFRRCRRGCRRYDNRQMLFRPPRCMGNDSLPSPSRFVGDLGVRKDAGGRRISSRTRERKRGGYNRAVARPRRTAGRSG